jgi:hypothetical protein
MFATFKLSWRDKPAWATLGHMLLTALGVFSLVVPWASLSVRACLLVLLSMAVPAMAVLYRMALMGRIYRPLGSLMLYYVYFTARAWAAAKLLILAIGRRLGAQDSHPSA